MASNTVETHCSPARGGAEKRLSEARTPSYDGAREGDSWPDGGPSLSDYVQGFYDGDPPEDAASEWDTLPQDAREWIAAKSLLGDPDASDVEDGISYPVVYPDEDLSEDGLESARQMAGHADGAAESIRTVTERLLEDEFGHDFESEESSKSIHTREFTKHVDIKSLDPTEQIAEGVVMVPNEVDHQGDFARGWAIRALEAGYSRRLEDGDVDHGVMHVKFPERDIDVVDSYTLDTPQDIGTESYPTDTWVIERKYHNDELWSLVEDGVISGYSIGGIIPDGGGVTYDADGIPGDVRVPSNVSVDDEVFEIRAGWIDEISDVDAPAVPRAQIQTLKASIESDADAEKATAEELTDPETAQDLLEERGHSEEDAARLAAYLTNQNYEMTDETEKSSTEQPSSDADADADGEAEAEAEAAAAVEKAEADTEASADVEDELEELGEEDVSFLKRLRSFFSGADEEAEKVGQRLSNRNQRRLMAAHDAIESALQSELDDRFETNRFTDDIHSDFDLGEYDGKLNDLDNPVALAKTITSNDFDRDSDDESEAEADADADPGVDPDESTETKDTDMTDETESAADAEKATDAETETEAEDEMPEWAKSLASEVEELKEKLDAEEEAEAEEAEAEKAEEKASETPAWAEDLVGKVEENAQRLDTVAKQGGVSQQLGDIDEDTLEQKRQELVEIENKVFD